MHRPPLQPLLEALNALQARAAGLGHLLQHLLDQRGARVGARLAPRVCRACQRLGLQMEGRKQGFRSLLGVMAARYSPEEGGS